MIFCNPYAPLPKKLQLNNSYLLITEEKMPDIDLSCLEDTYDAYILLIVSKYDSNKISSEFITILEQRFGEKMFTLLKRVSKINT